MRYRALDSNGDMTFGRGSGNFFQNVPDAVAQAIATRLKLWAGEWFLDVTEGTPYTQKILGKGTSGTYDDAIQQRILGTEGVLSLDAYDSVLNSDTRALSVQATVTTIYSQQPITLSVPLVPR